MTREISTHDDRGLLLTMVLLDILGLKITFLFLKQTNNNSTCIGCLESHQTRWFLCSCRKNWFSLSSCCWEYSLVLDSLCRSTPYLDNIIVLVFLYKSFEQCCVTSYLFLICLLVWKWLLYWHYLIYMLYCSHSKRFVVWTLLIRWR